MTVMPNFVGMDFLTATASITANGFTVATPVEVRIKSGPNSQMGIVIGQSIAAGGSYPSGTRVQLTVHKPFGQFPASEQNEPIPYWYFLTK